MNKGDQWFPFFLSMQIDQLQSKALEQFKTGKSLFGKGGAFAPMLKQFIEAALEAEMEAHLDEEERLEGNKRNGKGRKTINHTGPVEIMEKPYIDSNTSLPEITVKAIILGDHWNLSIASYGWMRCITRYNQRVRLSIRLCTTFWVSMLPG